MKKHGGHAAEATHETMPRLLWIDAVHTATIEVVGTHLPGVGPVGDWLRETQSERLNLAYRTGEPVWMVVDTMIAFAKGASRAAASDRDCIRNAIRAGRR